MSRSCNYRRCGVINRHLYLDEHVGEGERDILYDKTQLLVKINEGTYYGCRQKDIDDYQVYDDYNRPRKFISNARSTSILTSFLNPHRTPSDTVEKALDRIWKARWDPNWGPDVVIKALHDIDTAFFDNRLRGTIIVRWADAATIFEATHSGRSARAYGTTLDQGRGRSVVYFNADRIFNSPRPCQLMWETLFHELVHAYQNAMTGVLERHTPYDQRRGFPPVPLGHGWHFRWLLSHIDLEARTQLDFGVIPKKRPYSMDLDFERQLILEDAIKNREKESFIERGKSPQQNTLARKLFALSVGQSSRVAIELKSLRRDFRYYHHLFRDTPLNLSTIIGILRTGA